MAPDSADRAPPIPRRGPHLPRVRSSYKSLVVSAGLTTARPRRQIAYSPCGNNGDLVCASSRHFKIQCRQQVVEAFVTHCHQFDSRSLNLLLWL